MKENLDERSEVGIGMTAHHKSTAMKQDRVWLWLKEVRVAGTADVVKHFNLSKRAAAAILQRLVHKGCAAASGRPHHRRFRAIGQCPESQRGRAPATAINLAMGRVVGNNSRAARRGRLHLPRPVHPLDAVMRKMNARSR